MIAPQQLLSFRDPSKFLPGKIVITPGAAEALIIANQTPLDFLCRHLLGDWGDLSAEDKKANDAAIQFEQDVEKQARILSAYMTTEGSALWIITEWDRSVTTLLLPEEY